MNAEVKHEVRGKHRRELAGHGNPPQAENPAQQQMIGGQWGNGGDALV
jgi:hypothetical protein